LRFSWLTSKEPSVNNCDNSVRCPRDILDATTLVDGGCQRNVSVSRLRVGDIVIDSHRTESLVLGDNGGAGRRLALELGADKLEDPAERKLKPR